MPPAPFGAEERPVMHNGLWLMNGSQVCRCGSYLQSILALGAPCSDW